MPLEKSVLEFSGNILLPNMHCILDYFCEENVIDHIFSEVLNTNAQEAVGYAA
jgi:hypothetical protein